MTDPHGLECAPSIVRRGRPRVVAALRVRGSYLRDPEKGQIALRGILHTPVANASPRRRLCCQHGLRPCLTAILRDRNSDRRCAQTSQRVSASCTRIDGYQEPSTAAPATAAARRCLGGRWRRRRRIGRRRFGKKAMFPSLTVIFAGAEHRTRALSVYACRNTVRRIPRDQKTVTGAKGAAETAATRIIVRSQ